MQNQEEWTAAGHAGNWMDVAGNVIALVGVLAFAALVVRALVQRHRYRAVDVLSEADSNALAEEIARAEKRTTGEIVCVVVERSDPHPGAAWFAAFLTTFGGTLALAAWMPWAEPVALVAAQIGLAFIGFVCARKLPAFARMLVPEPRATAVAEEQALLEFNRAAIEETEGQTGVLLFVSLFERRVVVLGDVGVNERVGAEHWRDTDAAILAGIRGGSLRAGLERGIEMCGEVLARHFPWTDGDRDELPNHLIVRHE
ncbi:MAG: hypothetical protein GY711_03770 [bacterium]|nr:hypothetical protein [bacterium]